MGGQRPTGGGDQGATDHQDATSVPIGDPTDHRPGQDRREGEDRDGQADPEFAGVERALDEQRNDRHHHADVDEEDQRNGGDQHERPRDEARTTVLEIRERRHRVHTGGRNGREDDGIPRLTEVTSPLTPPPERQSRRTSTETVSVCGLAGPMVTPRNGATSA